MAAGRIGDVLERGAGSVLEHGGAEAPVQGREVVPERAGDLGGYRLLGFGGGCVNVGEADERIGAVAHLPRVG